MGRFGHSVGHGAGLAQVKQNPAAIADAAVGTFTFTSQEGYAAVADHTHLTHCLCSPGGLAKPGSSCQCCCWNGDSRVPRKFFCSS